MDQKISIKELAKHFYNVYNVRMAEERLHSIVEYEDLSDVVRDAWEKVASFASLVLVPKYRWMGNGESAVEEKEKESIIKVLGFGSASLVPKMGSATANINLKGVVLGDEDEEKVWDDTENIIGQPFIKRRK